jgi:ABC-type multidrug transport system ATPase subunit
MTEPRLLTRGLTKVYPGGWGLHGVSLVVPPGAIVALGGPNGSGKSTFLKCVAGLVRFTGAVLIDGVPVDSASGFRRSIGYLPQSVALPEQATVGEVLDLFARLRGADRAETPLPDGFVRPDGEKIATLSGGQRHRVALAAALLGTPPLLLLDEPVASLDGEGRDAFWDAMRRLRDERGMTAIVSSPAPSELRDVADRAVYLTDGRVALEEEFDAEELEACR